MILDYLATIFIFRPDPTAGIRSETTSVMHKSDREMKA
jgi:hypothetical protein